MIIQKISNDTQVIFTKNKASDFNRIVSELGYAKKDGGLYKYVEVNHSSQYRPSGSTTNIPATVVTAKNVKSYIIDNEFDFYFDTKNISNIITQFSHYGDGCIIRNNGVELMGPFKKVGTDVIGCSDSTTISVTSADNSNSSEVHKLIHRLKTDNGRLLDPILQRFSTMVFLFKGNKHLLTGYANLSLYLKTMKEPMPNFSNKTNSNSTYSIECKDAGISRLSVIDVKNGAPIIDFKFNGSFISSEKTSGQPTPHVLITTKPIKLTSEQLPYFVVTHRKVPLFVTPIIFNSQKILEELKGGVNLLK